MRWWRAKASPIWLQISDGEPTLHPDLFAILDAVRARPIRHVMLSLLFFCLLVGAGGVALIVFAIRR
jgi:hypothetical protein